MRNLTNEASYALAERLIAEAAEQNATHLDLSSLRLIDLPPSLGQLTQLQSLDLSDNYWLQDIRVLGELGQLQTLNLNNCGQLGILSPLAALTQLRELQLILSQPQHAEVLAKLTSLEQLDAKNRITNTGLQWLGHLSRLQKLVLHGFRHHGIQTPLPPLPDLQELQLRSFTPCQALLANLPQLKALTLALHGFGSSATPLQLPTLALPKGLQQLRLFHSALEGAGALDRLQQLTHLDINWCDMDATQLSLAQLVTLTSLKIHAKDSSTTSLWPQLPALQQLQQLSLTNAQAVDLAVLTAIPSLQDITMLGDTWPENWPALQALPNLQQLSMLAASLTDYRQLDQQPSLHSLDLAQCIHLTSLDWLQGLPELQLLSLRFCEQLSDVRGLHAVPSLTELGLSHCPQLRTLEGLEQCQRLQRLDLEHLPNLQRLDAVSTLTRLQDVSLFDCEQLQDLTPLASLKLLSEINMAGCLHIDDASVIAALPSLQTLTITHFPLLNNLPSLASAPVLQRLSLPDSKLPQTASEFTAVRALQMPGIELADLWQLPRLVEFGNYFDAQEIRTVPAELLGEDGENNLPALVSWQQDLLTSGESAVDELKVFILGNGRVGKTQLARSLQGQGFDSSIASTHGIEIGDFPLLEAGKGLPAIHARLWDFGGQDVYLNTHRLFLDERAIYVLAWHPDFENDTVQYEDGVPMRNRPLAYWLAYIRAHAGEDAPIIVVQTRCDEPEQEQAPPLSGGHGFRQLHHCASSAVTEDGIDMLQSQLRRAARLLARRLAEVRIPQSWASIATAISERQQAGDKLLAFPDFTALCGQHLTHAPPALLADYLHRSGKLFWQAGAFAGQLVLDQQWALQGLYALLQRNGPLAMLREQFGCFSSTQLAMTAWRDFTESDQQQYLQMMLQCGSCFALGDDQFLAPELLPDLARRQHDIDAIWRDGEAVAHIVLQYGFLQDGIIHAVLSAIGKLAGRAAVYWHNGVCYYDRTAKGAVRITARRATLPTQDYSGSIDIEVQGSHAANLARHLLDSVQSIRLREQAQVQWLRGSPENYPADEDDRPDPFSVIDPDPAISQLISAPDSRLVDAPAKPRQILAFATEWTSRHGGLSTFNRELCTALATQGAQVCCVVEQADEQEIEAARQDNVSLLLPPAGGDSSRSNMLRPLSLPVGFTPDILIGHGRITGGIALAQQQDFYQTAKRIHFLHMAAGEIEWFKGKDNAAQTAEQRDRQELELMRGASLVAAVGPKLKDHAIDLLNALPVAQRSRVIDFRPGFRIQESYSAHTVNFQCLMLCRAEDSELKGIDIAAHALAKLDGSKLQFQPELVIRGAVSGSGTQLQQVLQAQHSVLTVSVREYQPGEVVIEDLRRASLLLMPSRSEGFGLVALEALRVGTPILVSSETGFAMMLKELLTPHQWANFIVDTPSSPGQVEKAVDNWQREIELQLRDFDAAKRRAAELGKLLSEKLNWGDACRLLLGMPG